MQIIPVLDLAGGAAVHAQAGDRSRYAPVRSVLIPDRVGDPLALLRAFYQTLRAECCYVADLDAISGAPLQRWLLRELASLDTDSSRSLLVDGGVDRPERALELLACGVDTVVVGLETLRSFADLDAIAGRVDPSRIVFSIDLRLGLPILHPALREVEASSDPLALAARAVDTGVRTLLLLDLARVGTGSGLDLELLRAIRSRLPAARLLAGGGVRSRRDLDQMLDAGCDGALVASAIHAGKVTAADCIALASRIPQSATSASR